MLLSSKWRNVWKKPVTASELLETFGKVFLFGLYARALKKIRLNHQADFLLIQSFYQPHLFINIIYAAILPVQGINQVFLIIIKFRAGI